MSLDEKVVVVAVPTSSWVEADNSGAGRLHSQVSVSCCSAY